MAITQEYLKSILDYNPDTGIFTWKISKGNQRAGSKAGPLNGEGYEVIGIDGIVYKAHRLAFLYFYGWMPEEVDHINVHGPKFDNRICNLRDAKKQNQHNRKLQKNNKSGFKGVTFFKQSQKWRAEIRIGGVGVYLGLYETPEAAHEAYCEAAHRLHGDFARTE